MAEHINGLEMYVWKLKSDIKSNFQKMAQIRIAFILMVWFAWAVIPSGLLPVFAQDRFWRQIEGACDLKFPRDHGAHFGYQTEWWYYTGNLQAADGRRFGFQFTIFRRQLKPGDSALSDPAQSQSAWRTNQVFLGHAAVSDLEEGKHYHAETLSRGMPDLAGVSQTAGTTRVYLKQWEAVIEHEGHRLQAQGEDFAFQLELVPTKPPVRHGDRGYSRKGSTVERASCYYSFSRLAVNGTLRVENKTYNVRGLGWMDQEFSSAYLEPGLSGWDWFSLQLSDQTELMVFLLRNQQGGLSPASSGTFIDAEGQGHHLSREDLKLVPGKPWRSPQTGISYPLRWTMDIKPLNLRLDVEAAMPNQEMDTSATTGVIYWEGAVTAVGRRDGRPIDGRGYLEMTGRGGGGFETPL